MKGISRATRKRQREEFKVGKPHSFTGSPTLRGCKQAMTDAELKSYRDLIPPDDRTPMQRLLGEPPRHRSALGQRE